MKIDYIFNCFDLQDVLNETEKALENNDIKETLRGLLLALRYFERTRYDLLD